MIVNKLAILYCLLLIVDQNNLFPKYFNYYNFNYN